MKVLYRAIKIDEDLYKKLKNLAYQEGRTLSGQLRVILKWYLNTRKKLKETEKREE